MTQQEQKQVFKQALREVMEESGKNGKTHNSLKENGVKTVSRSFWNQILATVIAGIILTAGVSYGAIRLGMANLKYRMEEVESTTDRNCMRLDNHEDHIKYFRELHELPNDPIVTRGGRVSSVKLPVVRLASSLARKPVSAARR